MRKIDLRRPNDINIVNMSWSEINIIMISLQTTLRIQKNRVDNDASDMTANQQYEEYKKLFDTIEKQYPNWNGSAIGWAEQNINETLENNNL